METATQEDHDKAEERIRDLEGKFNIIWKAHEEMVKVADGLKKELEEMRNNQTMLQERMSKMENEMEKEMDRKKSHEKSFAEIVKQQADEVKQTKSELQSKIQGMAKVLEEQRADLVQEQGIGQEGGRQKLKHNREECIKIQVTEAMETEKRKYNVVIRGVAETEDAEKMVERLWKELHIGEGKMGADIQTVERIGYKNKDRIRLIRVKLMDLECRRKLLFAARGLTKSEDFKEVYIMPDWTRKQVENDRHLRFKLRQFREQYKDSERRVRIYKGRVVIGEGENEEVLFELKE